MDYKKLGSILREARISTDIGQQQAAEKVNKTRQNISSWELGKSKIDIESLNILCKFYNISFIDTLKQVDDNITPITSKPPKIIYTYNKLNRIGQKKADEYINDLVGNPKYVKSEKSKLPDQKDEEMITVFTAAHSNDNRPPRLEQMSKREFEDLASHSDVESDDDL